MAKNSESLPIPSSTPSTREWHKKFMETGGALRQTESGRPSRTWNFLELQIPKLWCLTVPDILKVTSSKVPYVWGINCLQPIVQTSLEQVRNIADGHWAWEPAQYEPCVCNSSMCVAPCEALSVVSVIHRCTYQYIPVKYTQIILRSVPHPQHSCPHAQIPCQSTHETPTYFWATHVSMVCFVLSFSISLENYFASENLDVPRQRLTLPWGVNLLQSCVIKILVTH